MSKFDDTSNQYGAIPIEDFQIKNQSITNKDSLMIDNDINSLNLSSTAAIANSIIENISSNNFIVTESIFSNDKFSTLKNYIENGEFEFKIIGLAVNCGFILSGFLGFFGNIFVLDLAGAIFDIIVLIIGILSAAIEYKFSIIPNIILDYVKSEIHIFISPIGRSMVYIVLGVILMTQDWLFDNLIGLGAVCGGG
jgi:hypothetical protein